MSRISRLARQSPVLLSAIAAVLLAALQPPAAEQPAVGVDIPPTGGVAADGKASVYRGHAQ